MSLFYFVTDFIGISSSRWKRILPQDSTDDTLIIWTSNAVPPPTGRNHLYDLAYAFPDENSQAALFNFVNSFVDESMIIDDLVTRFRSRIFGSEPQRETQIHIYNYLVDVYNRLHKENLEHWSTTNYTVPHGKHLLLFTDGNLGEANILLVSNGGFIETVTIAIPLKLERFYTSDGYKNLFEIGDHLRLVEDDLDETTFKKLWSAYESLLMKAAKNNQRLPLTEDAITLKSIADSRWYFHTGNLHLYEVYIGNKLAHESRIVHTIYVFLIEINGWNFPSETLLENALRNHLHTVFTPNPHLSGYDVHINSIIKYFTLKHSLMELSHTIGRVQRERLAARKYIQILENPGTTSDDFITAMTSLPRKYLSKELHIGNPEYESLFKVIVATGYLGDIQILDDN